VDINKLIEDCDFQFRVRRNGQWYAVEPFEMGNDIYDFFTELHSRIADHLDEVEALYEDEIQQ
jgi:hypothetical protein